MLGSHPCIDASSRKSEPSRKFAFRQQAIACLLLNLLVLRDKLHTLQDSRAKIHVCGRSLESGPTDSGFVAKTPVFGLGVPVLIAFVPRFCSPIPRRFF
jgi:hypothetical protein